MEHFEHFGLREDPFTNDPLPHFIVEVPEQLSAERRLLRAVRQGRGLCVLTGAVGSGKTAVARDLLDALDAERFEASLLVLMPDNQEPGRFLQRIAVQLGVAEDSEADGSLLRRLHEKLMEHAENGRRCSFLVDEAQLLAAPANLALLRGLLNLECNDRYLLSLVLFGLPELAAAVWRTPALAHRVDVWVELTGMNQETLEIYLAHRISRAGGDPDLVAAAALEALYRRSLGFPRRINALADHALFEAYLAGAHKVTERHVEAAARSLCLAPEANSRPGESDGSDWDRTLVVEAEDEVAGMKMDVLEDDEFLGKLVRGPRDT